LTILLTPICHFFQRRLLFSVVPLTAYDRDMPTSDSNPFQAIKSGFHGGLGPS
jgi:hypothetical protein